MTLRPAALLALLVPLAACGSPPAPSPDPRFACVGEQVGSLGYRVIRLDGARGELVAEREVVSAGSLMRDAGAFATRVASLGRLSLTPIRRVERLSVRVLGPAAQADVVATATLEVGRGERWERQWPRARTVLDAYGLSERCSAGPSRRASS